MLKTRLCELLKIEYPILQGGMAWVSTAELASAVSEAGGLGIIAAGHNEPGWLRNEIKKAKENTDKSFGVNLMLLSPHVEGVINVVLEEGVPVVTTGAGNPGKYLSLFKEKGMKVIPVVPSVSLAKRLEKQGVDAVIVEGTESGGHVGELTTMALVPQVTDAIKIPVIAAGGIGNGKGITAALALGADGVQLGTRFVCTTECTVHQAWKDEYIKAKDRDTIVTGRPTGHPVRIIKNKLAKEFERLEELRAPMEEFEKLGTGRLKAAAQDGDTEFGSIMAGQIVGIIKEIIPVKKLMEQLVNEVYESIENLNKKLG